MQLFRKKAKRSFSVASAMEMVTKGWSLKT